ncbi:MAG: hypothetical protein ACRCUZ_02945, partial [Shewanella sp.]
NQVNLKNPAMLNFTSALSLTMIGANTTRRLVAGQRRLTQSLFRSYSTSIQGWDAMLGGYVKSSRRL